MSRHTRIFLPFLLLASCDGTNTGSTTAPPSTAGPSSPPPAQPADDPAPTVSLALNNGGFVNVYEVGDRVLVTEKNDAYAAPVLPRLGLTSPADQLPQMFVALKPYLLNPDMPMPDALLAIEQRLAAASPDSKESPSSQLASMAPAGAKPGLASTMTRLPRQATSTGPSSALLEGCNNGCCDPDWTANSLCNQVYTWPWNKWYLFNEGWSQTYNSEVIDWHGLICSASGTTSFNIQVGDGTNRTFYIAEGNYTWYNWNLGNGFTHTIIATGDSPNNGFHMFCGSSDNCDHCIF